MGLLQRLARCGTSRKNVCRNLHRLLNKSGLQYPVPLTWVSVTIRLRKPKPHHEVLDWPMIKLSDWVRVLVEHSPEYILGGMRLEDMDGWAMLLGIIQVHTQLASGLCAGPGSKQVCTVCTTWR